MEKKLLLLTSDTDSKIAGSQFEESVFVISRVSTSIFITQAPLFAITIQLLLLILNCVAVAEHVVPLVCDFLV